ncbi:hypothetical protein BCR34DRAFT_360429 [Clohesyomyces aquaticus]|uniref:BTB domain-containing protein n=1 Tax=Clohesyomyces aquaticus TaxID=1231657 RepID=A0A1Y2A6K1_9PLEO|nr:hypothetical protein BCR34DRAFT_360429 [Clohesyomyces aquaticus]
MDSVNVELLSALASYSVHRALVCSRSEFFDAACRNPFKESETGVIDLTEDDPEAVEHMVNYLYHLDYLKKPLSRRSSQRSSRPSSPTSRRQRSKKLNLALIEDPLLATMAAANQSARDPMTPPDEQANHFDDSLDSAKFPDTPLEEAFQEDPFEAVETEPETAVEKAHLLTHAKVYAIAEKYAISGLKALARKKFAQQIEVHLSSPEFPEACQEAYETTVDSDRGLRDVIIQTFRANPDLTLRKDVELAVRETPSLAFELFRMASGMPVFT